MMVPRVTVFVLVISGASFDHLFGQGGSLVTATERLRVTAPGLVGGPASERQGRDRPGPLLRLAGPGDSTLDAPLLAANLPAPSVALARTGPLSAAGAQQNDTTTKELCFRGRPLPYCRWFILTEVGYSVRLATTSDLGDVRVGRISVELGGMRNLGTHSALGATLFFLGLDADESRAGVRARYRRWLEREFSTEVAAGILLEANDVPSGSAFDEGSDVRGFSGQVSFDYRNILALSTQVDIVDAQRSTQVDWFVGARAGSGVGAAGAVALAAVTLIGIFVALGSF